MPLIRNRVAWWAWWRNDQAVVGSIPGRAAIKLPWSTHPSLCTKYSANILLQLKTAIASMFYYAKYHNVTDILLDLMLPSCDTVICNFCYAFNIERNYSSCSTETYLLIFSRKNECFCLRVSCVYSVM